MAIYLNGFNTTITCIVFALFVSGSDSLLQGQDWHISNPPVSQSQPQYRPGSTATPIENAKKLMPPQKQIQQQLQPSVPQQPVSRYPLSDNANRAVVKSLSPTTPTTPAAKQGHKEPKQPYGLDFSEYRDYNQFPIDPRKPCNTCVRPPQVQPVTKHHLTGLFGRPHMEKEPGGCRCGKKGCPKCSDRSIYWPLPRSARMDARHPQRAMAREQNCRKRINDLFDPLADIKISNYKRKDNGYCGTGSDPYGCLGESRQRGVSGIGFRSPGDPAAQPAPFNYTR
jgi:hypothetical protein